MIGLQIAVQTQSLAQPLKQALLTASRIGADGVQLDARVELPPHELSDTGARQLRKALDDLNLRVGSVTFASRRGYANPQDLERRLAATVDAMRLASRLHARVLVFAMGPLTTDDAAARATLVEALTALATQGSRLGVELAAQCAEASPVDVLELIRELPDGLMGVDLSPADVIRSGRSPREFVERLGPHIVHVYANDAVRGAGGDVRDVQLGRGSADVPELIGALEEYNYRGWATIQRRNSSQPVEDCADAAAYLRAL